MVIFSKPSAIKAFYYLMSADGAVTADELECFDSIGREFDADHFDTYKAEAIAACESQLASGIDEEDSYELILEGIDQELAHRSDSAENGITTRLLVWNMLVIAFSNTEYSVAERKVIKHIVRVTGMEKSVFLEMEQIMKTNAAVLAELDWIQKSNRPYSEIRPIVDELERRQQAVIQCAQKLIADELYTPVEKAALPDNKIYAEVKRLEDNIAKGTVDLGHKAADFTRTAAANFGRQAKKLLGSKKEASGKDHPKAEVFQSEDAENQEVQ